MKSYLQNVSYSSGQLKENIKLSKHKMTKNYIKHYFTTIIYEQAKTNINEWDNELTGINESKDND